MSEEVALSKKDVAKAKMPSKITQDTYYFVLCFFIFPEYFYFQPKIFESHIVFQDFWQGLYF